MSTQQQESPFPSGVAQPGSEHIELSHEAMIWLIVVGIIVFLTIVTIIWLACRCSCTKRRRQRARKYLDDRDDYPAWNLNAPPNDRSFAMKDYHSGANDGSPVLTPLTRAAARPTGFEPHPGEPIIVDEAMPEPVYGNVKNNAVVARKESRPFSGWSKRFSRFSQIGVAK